MNEQTKGILEAKSFTFAISIVNLSRFLVESRREYVLSKQLLRAGTSIGANISEAQFAQSKADFGTKMQISLKEANETRYWLRLLQATGFLQTEEANSYLVECNELINMLVSTCKKVLPRN